MDDDRTIAQALARVRDAGSALAFIEWFAREWLTPLRDGDGCTGEEVAAVEERLGLRLPASLAAFYRLLGWRRDLTSSQDTLIALNSLLREDSRTWLWVLARNAAGLARVRDALPGGWQDSAADLQWPAPCFWRVSITWRMLDPIGARILRVNSILVCLRG